MAVLHPDLPVAGQDQVGGQAQGGSGHVPDRVRRVADHDHDVTQPHRSQVAQGDVEDGDLAVDRQQGFGQLVGVRPQPAPRAGRQDHTYQVFSRNWRSPVGSNHPLRKSQQKSNQRYPETTA